MRAKPRLSWYGSAANDEGAPVTQPDAESRRQRFIAATDRIPLPATKYAPLLGCWNTHVSDVRRGREPASLPLVLSAERLADTFDALTEAERGDLDAVVARLRGMVAVD